MVNPHCGDLLVREGATLGASALELKRPKKRQGLKRKKLDHTKERQGPKRKPESRICPQKNQRSRIINYHSGNWLMREEATLAV